MAYLAVDNISHFRELDEWLTRNPSGRLGYKTVVRREDRNIVIRQWNTDIYTITPENIATLNVGDWYTVTTKQRLADLLPMGMNIYSERGRWFIHCSGELLEPFANGIQINVETAEVIANPNLGDVAKEDAEIRKMKRKIAAYVKGLTDEKVRELATSNPTGDCFFCYMRVAATGQSLGDVNGDNTHLLEHIEEKYYMPSLNYNALQDARVGSPAYCMQVGHLVRHSVSKYLRKRLLKGIAI